MSENNLPIHSCTNKSAHLKNVEALRRFKILDSAPDNAYDHIVDIAARVFQVPIVLVSLIDLDRQWFKARVGLDACETGLDVSFCTYAVKKNEVLVVKDATQDDRFKANPLVAGEPGIRFYAGAPLRTYDGYLIGTLCLVDTQPRQAFSEVDSLLLAQMASLVVDFMEGRASQRQSVEAQKKLDDFTSASLDVFWETDAEHRFTHFASASSSDSFVGNGDDGDAFNTLLSDMLGRTRWDVLNADLTQEPWVSHLANLKAQKPFRDMRYSVQLSNDVHYFSVSGKPVFDDTGCFVGYRGATNDVTLQEKARLHAERLANSDALTGLANRRHWNFEVQKRLDNAHSKPAAILLLDVDRFKDINDALGHAVGDALLIEIAKRIVNCLNDACLAARLGGDEFAVLVEGDPRQAAECVIITMREQMALGDQQLGIEVSLGVREITGELGSLDDLMIDADLALRTAKEAGRNKYVVFDRSMRTENDNRISVITQLDRAIACNEFELFYQPQVNLHENRIVGMEGLLRWKHPDNGIMLPSEFLSALENSSFDITVGRRIIELACKQAARWHKNGTPVRVSINVSSSQLYGDNLAQVLATAIDRYEVPPSLLEVEITERVALGNVEKIKWVLDQLKELGLSIAFDDFGTGYASLCSLMQFPIDRVKIDRSFIFDMSENRLSAQLTNGLINLCHSLELEVIAEGVETAEHAALLSAQGCDEAQGYYFGKPLSMRQATKLLISNNSPSSLRTVAGPC